MSFSIAGLVQEVVETSKDWGEIFKANFGKAGNLAIQAADEAFYHLLEKGKHAAVVAVWETNWPFVLRAGILRSFMTGKSTEKDKDGKIIEHQYPPAPREQSEKVAAAVAPLLMSRVMSLSVASRPVDREYWFVDKEAGKRFDTAPIGLAIGAMHALLNITEDLGDSDGRCAVARAWIAKFGTLPGPVFYRIKDIFDHAPTPAAKPVVVTIPAPQNDSLKRQLDALRKQDEPVTPAEAAEFSEAVEGMSNISPAAIDAATEGDIPAEVAADKAAADAEDENRQDARARKNGGNNHRKPRHNNGHGLPDGKYFLPTPVAEVAAN